LCFLNYGESLNIRIGQSIHRIRRGYNRNMIQEIRPICSSIS